MEEDVGLLRNEILMLLRSEILKRRIQYASDKERDKVYPVITGIN